MMMYIIHSIIVALICGAIGAKIAGAGRAGCLGFIVLGIIIMIIK